MKRRWRIAGRIALGLAALFVMLVAATITTVDRRPLEAFPTLRAALSPSELANQPMAVSGALRAGFGRARMTPTTGAAADHAEAGEFRSLPLAGYGAREGRPATGVHDELWAKAIAFAVAGQTGVVVTADVLIIPREVTALAMQRLADTWGLRREQVYFSATHTHGGPGGWGDGPVGEAFAGPFQPGIREWLAQQLARAAESALEDLTPAELGATAFDAPEFIRNRLAFGDGAVDATFALVLVRQSDGDRAVLGNYGAHATVAGADVMAFHGDYASAWQRSMEEREVGLALFAAGGVGSHAPRAPAGDLAGAETMGLALAEATRRALHSLAVTNRIRFGMATLSLPLPPLQARLTESVRLRPWVARQLLPVGDEVLLQGIRWDEAIWLSTPCDFSGELALELKASRPAGAPSLHATSFNGDYVGYVVPARYFNLPGYETRTMSFFGPQLPEYFMAGLRRIADQLSAPDTASSHAP